MLKDNEIYLGDCKEVLKDLPDESVDLIATDIPYGLTDFHPMQLIEDEEKKGRGFMNKNWDMIPTTETFKECLRVLKSGAFFMTTFTPRQDAQLVLFYRLMKAGFEIKFTPIYFTYATGFPKAMNIGKSVDKRLGVERENGKLRTDGRGASPQKIINHEKGDSGIGHADGSKKKYFQTKATSPQAKELDGSYAGFQPKPAVEPIIIAMKPLSEKSYLDQAMKNKKGIVWFDKCRIPYINQQDMELRDNLHREKNGLIFNTGKYSQPKEDGRFPANLLVSDDVLNDGEDKKSGYMSPLLHKRDKTNHNDVMGVCYGKYNNEDRPLGETYGDCWSYSRFFSIDEWWKVNFNKLPDRIKKVYPFLIEPKPCSSEKDEGLQNAEERQCRGSYDDANQMGILEKIQNSPKPTAKNFHPTCKSIQLMSYLIILGSMENDLILDPFCGSGTTCISARINNRRFIGIEKEKEYYDLAVARLKKYKSQLKLTEMFGQ